MLLKIILVSILVLLVTPTKARPQKAPMTTINIFPPNADPMGGGHMSPYEDSGEESDSNIRADSDLPNDETDESLHPFVSDELMPADNPSPMQMESDGGGPCDDASARMSGSRKRLGYRPMRKAMHFQPATRVQPAKRLGAQRQ